MYLSCTEIASGSKHAFLYNDAMHDLDILPSSSNSAASDINNFGQVVGFSDTGTLNSEGKPLTEPCCMTVPE